MAEMPHVLRRFYLNNDAFPVTISYVHPSDARPVLMDHLLDRRSPNGPRSGANQLPIVSANKSRGPRTPQQIYDSSPNPSAGSPAPSGPTPVANTRLPRSDDGKRNGHNPSSRSDRQSSSSINLGAPAPVPPVTTAQNGYPPQLLTYLATNPNLSKYSNQDGQTAVPRHTALAPYPVAPRPSSSRGPNSNAQELTVAKPTSREPMSAPPGLTQHVSNGAPHRTQSSYSPNTVPTPPVAVLSPSSTSSVGEPSGLVASTTVTPVSIVRPLAIRQRPVTQPAPVSPPSASLPPSSSPNVQWVSDKHKPHRHASGSESSTPSLYPSHLTGFVPPQATSASLSSGLTSPASNNLPPTTNQSSSIAFSSPTLASHQRSMPQAAHVSAPSTPSLALPAPNVRRASDRPEPQRYVSTSEMSTPSSHPSPPKFFSSPSQYVNPVSPPTSYPFPPTANQSSSTTFSSPTLASHQRSATQPAYVSPPSAIPPPSPTPNVHWISDRPEPHRHVSAPELSTSSPYPSPPTQFSSPHITSASTSMGSISPPDSYSFPPIANQSSSTTLSSRLKSLPPTPALTHSTPSQPPTPLYDPMPPTPQAPLTPRTPVASQPAPKSGGFGRKAMLTMAGGVAVGMLKGTLKNTLGGDGGLDMNGIVDSVGDMMDGAGDVDSGDLLNGVFNAGDGTDNNNPYSLDAFFDPSSQGNSDGSDPTSIFNQTSQNLYNQYQQQQQSGPDYVHIAHEAYNQTYHAQQQHQQAGHHVGPPAGAGQASSGAQHGTPLHAQTAQHGQSHQHSQTYPYGQASQYGQTTQPPQAYNTAYNSAQAVQPGPESPPGQKQGIKINANHVKQAAKGALLAGRVLAKWNGVNIGNN